MDKTRYTKNMNINHLMGYSDKIESIETNNIGLFDAKKKSVLKEINNYNL